jgi:hypothetical protein
MMRGTFSTKMSGGGAVPGLAEQEQRTLHQRVHPLVLVLARSLRREQPREALARRRQHDDVGRLGPEERDQVGRLELVDVGAERGRAHEHLEVAARLRIDIDPADGLERRLVLAEAGERLLRAEPLAADAAEDVSDAERLLH